jgi:hypothetical protein
MRKFIEYYIPANREHWKMVGTAIFGWILFALIFLSQYL